MTKAHAVATLENKIRFKLSLAENKLETYSELLEDELAQQEAAETDYMKDYHNRSIYRYRAIIEMVEESIQDFKDLLED